MRTERGTSMKGTGYSLDENVLNAQLTAIKQERDAERVRSQAQPVISVSGIRYRRIRKGKAALSASHFNNKKEQLLSRINFLRRAETAICYGKGRAEIRLTKAGRCHVDQILDATFRKIFWAIEIKIEWALFMFGRKQSCQMKT